MTRRSSPRGRAAGRRSPLRTVFRSLLRLFLALVLALWVMVPFLHWELRPDLVEYIVPWLLRPSTGFLSFVAVFWIWIEGPGMLRALASPPRTEQEPPVVEEPGEKPGEELLTVPTAAPEALGLEHRVEMARALGIPWEDELLVDQQEWARVCRAAARDRAAAVRP